MRWHFSQFEKGILRKTAKETLLFRFYRPHNGSRMQWTGMSGRRCKRCNKRDCNIRLKTAERCRCMSRPPSRNEGEELQKASAILLRMRKHFTISKVSFIFTQIFNGNLATVVVKGRLTLDRKGWLLHLKWSVEVSDAGRSGIIPLLPLRH